MREIMFYMTFREDFIQFMAECRVLTFGGLTLKTGIKEGAGLNQNPAPSVRSGIILIYGISCEYFIEMCKSKVIYWLTISITSWIISGLGYPLPVLPFIP